MAVHARLARLAASTIAGALALTASASALPTTSCADTSPNISSSAISSTPVPAPAEQMVEIDGRFYKIELSINRFIGGAPGPDGPSITTTVSVQLSVNDGALLPDDLRAAGVRFETVRGLRRVFFKPLTPLDVTTQDAIFEEDFQNYIGDLSERTQVQRLRATVRLEYGDQVIRVPFGVRPVIVTALP